MRYVRSDKSMDFSSSFEFNSYIKLLVKLVDIYSATSVHPNFWLTDTEKVFFACAVYCLKRGETSLVSPNSMDVFREYYKPKVTKQEIHDYTGYCKKKRWLTRKSRRSPLSISGFFQDVKGPGEGEKITFNLELLLKEDNEGNRQDLGQIDLG